MRTDVRKIIATLGLSPLPEEGGFFRPTWRTATASGILFLITPDHFSALHRLTRDEVWHFHTGDPVELAQLDPRTGTSQISRLGPGICDQHALQILVPAGVWQGARVLAGKCGYALLGCTVSPPWQEGIFELGRRAVLAQAFPNQRALITALTR